MGSGSGIRPAEPVLTFACVCITPGFVGFPDSQQHLLPPTKLLRPAFFALLSDEIAFQMLLLLVIFPT